MLQEFILVWIIEREHMAYFLTLMIFLQKKKNIESNLKTIKVSSRFFEMEMYTRFSSSQFRVNIVEIYYIFISLSRSDASFNYIDRHKYLYMLKCVVRQCTYTPITTESGFFIYFKERTKPYKCEKKTNRNYRYYIWHMGNYTLYSGWTFYNVWDIKLLAFIYFIIICVYFALYTRISLSFL